MPRGSTLRAEFGPLPRVPRWDSQAGPHGRHTHAQATHSWDAPATASAVDDTAMDTPLPRNAVTHQELVRPDTAIRTRRHRISPRGARTHMGPAKSSRHGHPQGPGWPTPYHAGRFLDLS